MSAPTERLLRRRQVEDAIGMSRSSIYRMMLNGEFPRPLKRRQLAYWPESVVQDWIRQEIERATQDA